MALKKLPQSERLLSGTLSAYLSAAATTIDVSTPPDADRLPTYIEIEPDAEVPETVRIIGVSGNTITIERGVYTGGVGVEHQSNSTYKQKITTKHWQAVVDAVESGYLTEDDSYTLTRTDADTFRVDGVDFTTFYTAGRILRLSGSNIVEVISSSYTGGNTVIEVSGTVPDPLTSVEIAIGPKGATDKFVTLVGTQTLTNKTLTSPKIGTAIKDTNGNEVIKTPATASAVNEVTVTNAATGNAPEISATGDDTNIGLKLTPKGTGKVEVTANDVTLPTGGNIQENGADPSRSIVIPAGAMSPCTTSPCASAVTVEAGTNDVDYKVLDFDTSTPEMAFVLFQMPNSWDGGTITFQAIWTAASGSGNVVFGLKGRAFANDDAIDQAYGTEQTVDDTLITAGDVHISPESSAITLAGSPAGGQMVQLKITRQTGSDTLGVDARLIGIRIMYKQAKYSD